MRNLLTRPATFAGLALIAAAATSSSASAQIAPGSTLTFTGIADAIDLGSPGVFLDFDKRVTAGLVEATGSFSSLNPKPKKPGSKPAKGANGSIRSITVGNGPQSVRKFVQFGPYKFDLTSVPSGSYGQDDCYIAPEVGQRCTPYQSPGFELSPFYLENMAAPSGSDGMFTALVKFDVAGVVTAHGRTSNFTGTFTAMFDGLSYQEALGGLEQYGMEGIPFTGVFVTDASAARTMALSAQATVTPEPTTAVLVAIGLVGMMGVARRRTRRV